MKYLHLRKTTAQCFKNFIFIIKFSFSKEPRNRVPAVGKSDEHSAPNRRTWVRDSPGETPPFTLTDLLHVKSVVGVMYSPIQNIPLRVPKRGNHSLRGGSKLWWHVSEPSLEISLRLLAIPINHKQPNPKTGK